MKDHIIKIWKPVTLCFLVVMIYAFLASFLVHNVFASEIIDQENTAVTATGFIGYNNLEYGQSFLPTKNNVSSYKMIGKCGSGNYATTTLTFSIYQGETLLRSYPNNSYKCSSTQELNIIWIVPDSYPLEIGQTYSIRWYQDVGHMGFKHTIANGYTNGQALGPSVLSTWDFKFTEYYDDGYVGVGYDPSHYDNISVLESDEILFLNYPALSFKTDYWCMATTSTSSSCKIDFRFNKYSENSNVYLYQESDGHATGTLLASSSIISNPSYVDWITAPNEASSTRKTYCVYLYDPISRGHDVMYCGMTVNWVSEDDLRLFDKCTSYNIESACADMDQSASSTFLYGIECGFKKTVYWSMNLDTETCLDMYETLTSFKDNFPLSVYYQVKDVYMSLPIQASTSSSTIRVPLMWAGQDTGKDIFNADMVKNALGEKWIFFNHVCSMFLYALTLLYFVQYIFNKGKDDTYHEIQINNKKKK